MSFEFWPDPAGVPKDIEELARWSEDQFRRLGGVLGVGNARIPSPSVPASASSAGSPGDLAWDSSYIYVCVATDTWKRAAIGTW